MAVRPVPGAVFSPAPRPRPCFSRSRALPSTGRSSGSGGPQLQAVCPTVPPPPAAAPMQQSPLVSRRSLGLGGPQPRAVCPTIPPAPSAASLPLLSSASPPTVVSPAPAGALGSQPQSLGLGGPQRHAVCPTIPPAPPAASPSPVSSAPAPPVASPAPAGALGSQSLSRLGSYVHAALGPSQRLGGGSPQVVSLVPPHVLPSATSSPGPAHPDPRAPVAASGFAAFPFAGVALPKVPVSPSRDVLDFSIVSQLDGLLFGMFGIRLERDVLAPSRSASHTTFCGRFPFESLATFTGLFQGTDADMFPAVKRAIAERSCGVFVIPAKLPASSGEVLVKSTRFQWQTAVLRSARVCFPLATSSLTSGIPHVAVFADFGMIQKFKSKRRKETSVPLSPIPELNVGSRQLGPVPVLQHRVSPLADSLAPDGSSDVAPRCKNPKGPFPSIAQIPSSWDTALIERWAASYPHKRVVQLAVAAAGIGNNPYRGDTTKSVGINSASLRPVAADFMPTAETLLIDKRMTEEVSKNRTSGPYDDFPVPVARPCSFFSIPKKKHDVTNLDIRLVQNFSDGGMSSVNANCWAPWFLAFFLGALHLRERIFFCGPDALVWAADIPECFRQLRVHPALWFLMLYIVRMPGGVKVFLDQSCPFGFACSEWSWQALLAILMWRLWCLGVTEAMAYVDNFWLISPGQSAGDRATHAAKVVKMESMFTDAGISLHDRFSTSVFPGLGWMWDCSNMLMRCPEDKFGHFRRYLTEWIAMPFLSLEIIEKACGLLQWVTAGFPVGQSDLGHLIHLRTVAGRASALTGSSRKSLCVPVPERATSALMFWHKAFMTWDGTCPILQVFSPVASWEVTGRVDASTDFGCGGFAFTGSGVFYFIHEWTAAERDFAKVKSRESTAILEMLGIQYWLREFEGLCRHRRVLLECDNEAVVWVLETGYSKVPGLLDSLLPVRVFLVQNHVTLRARHVYGVVNVCADHLSHNKLSAAQECAQSDFGQSMNRYQPL